MRKMVTILLMCISFVSMSAETQHGGTAPVDPNYNLSLIAGGALGVVLASGAVGLVTASSMVLEGAGLTEAMEAGAGLTMPLAVLSAILGAFFTQEFMLRNINTLQAGMLQKGGSSAH